MSLRALSLRSADAQVLEQALSPEFSALDLVSLPNYEICLKLMVEKVVSSPFSAQTLRMPD
jgi:hypothetical protein